MPELRTRKLPGYAEPIPHLEYTGIADVSSMDVFDVGAQSLQTAQLKTILGDEYDWLASEDRPPRARWGARRGVTPQLPTE
jgi:hypothetical protein